MSVILDDIVSFEYFGPTVKVLFPNNQAGSFGNGSEWNCTNIDNGFISTLNILNYTDIDEGTYTFVVKNNFSVTEERITAKNSGM
jgi:hypothetical protein